MTTDDRYLTIPMMCDTNCCSYISAKRLKYNSHEMGKPIIQIYSEKERFYMNAYHIEVWHETYPNLQYPIDQFDQPTS